MEALRERVFGPLIIGCSMIDALDEGEGRVGTFAGALAWLPVGEKGSLGDAGAD